MGELLRRSDHSIANVFPRALYTPISFPVMKLYVHYDDAWWRNYLGLEAGHFFNTEPAHPSIDGAPLQLPTPFQGQYHDGDTRCDGKDGHCRGYLQVFYAGDNTMNPGGIDHALSYYAAYQDSRVNDSVVHLTPSNVHHRALLSDVHSSLVDFHKSQLADAKMTDYVSKMMPSSAVLSIWSQGVEGIGGGCHSPKGGNNPSPTDLPSAALQPLAGLPIFVANEAYGKQSCFAEGSLDMAEAALKRMNISTPAWLGTANPDSFDVPLVPTDPFLMRGGRHVRRFYGEDEMRLMDVSV